MKEYVSNYYGKIPWVVQEGNTQTDRNSETDPVDPADDLFTRDFIKD